MNLEEQYEQQYAEDYYEYNLKERDNSIFIPTTYYGTPYTRPKSRTIKPKPQSQREATKQRISIDLDNVE